MPALETRHSQFGVAGETTQAANEMVLAVVPAGLFAPEARKGQLHIVAECEGPRARECAQLVLRTIRKAFYEDSSFSVTSALRKAIIAANRALYQQNFSAPAQRRGLVGITCAVLREGDLYVARVAPGQCYMHTGGKVRAIPPSQAWDSGGLPAAPASRSQSLGASLTVEPEFYRAVMSAGDSLLLCTSALAPHLPRDLVTRLLRAADPPEAARELATLSRTAGLAEAHGALLALQAPLSPVAQASQQRGGVVDRGRRAASQLSAALAGLMGDLGGLLRSPGERARRASQTARGERADREARQLGEVPHQPLISASPPPMPRPIDLGEPIADQLARARPARLARSARSSDAARRLPPSALLGEAGYSGPPPVERRIDLGDPIPKAGSQGPGVAPAFQDQRRGAVGRISGYLARTRRERRMQRTAPRAMAQPRRTPGLSYRRESPPFPWARVLVLASLVLVLILYGWTLNSRNQIQEADTTLTQAEQAVAQIYDSPDEATARDRLRSAAEAIAAVQSTGTLTTTVDGRQRYDALRREYDQALTAIQKVSYFEDLTEVARNPQPGALFASVIVPPPPRGITNTLAFTSIYLVDANTGLLYQQSKGGGTPQAILRPQDRVGPLSVGRILGADWRFDTIVALAQSSDGGPYNYYFRSGDAWSYSILAGSEEWGAPKDGFRFANYEGNLYVWGVTPGNILRYRSGSYGEFPEPWIQNDGGKKFDSTLDIAVDGKIYLLQPDGRVLVFASNAGGERAFEREIVPQGIDPPLTTVSHFAITGEPDDGFIFLVDGYNGRVIQLDKKTGAFIQQIRARPDSPAQLDNLVSIAVDVAPSRPVIYLVNGSQILRAPLPDRPRPFRDAASGTPGATPAATPRPAVTPAPTGTAP